MHEVSDWRERAAEHEARADALTAGRRARRSVGAVDPVDDFLYDYYALRPGQLRRWHPGAGAVLVDAADAPHREWRWYREDDGGRVTLDVVAFAADRGRAVRTSHRLLSSVRDRAPHLGCFGMHEWAMVYRSEDGERRHGLPLRLGRAGTDEVVETHPLRCSHIDAYRFFTPDALPRNAAVLTRDTQAEFDQPGCIHVSMDVLRHAIALGPACPGALLLDCFEAARAAREIDMRASPYDVSGPDGTGLAPIRVETREGKVAYAAAQRELAAIAAPLRERLLRVCEAAESKGTER
ncbi:hypothetical protein SAMN06264364_12461 [Quadrisphaera granulorum]|uniref:3-methyladenine DNA glycosylase n=1 Tax=Quadrisphaera granulorum TaxID=317664 RepID=A0A315ZWH4_9ACTN|nr:3-methyladenine DNA glycosylase [Quadrisphaera granulorum]PWJ49895.1 hypothetical protein BXY45_12461 [Quadrisphaera granulorum]SZE98103.1 hypothetical protein SAMN06264364_12461 [Quadrisphaera granulorum]